MRKHYQPNKETMAIEDFIIPMIHDLSRLPRPANKIDFAIITALPEELKAVLSR